MRVRDLRADLLEQSALIEMQCNKCKQVAILSVGIREYQTTAYWMWAI
jgi:phage FluMu protein Com